MNDEDWAVDDEALNNVNEAVCMTKTAAERKEGLEILERLPMTFPLLIRTGAGRKITRVFKSSRFFDVAHKTHKKWLQNADDELQKNWSDWKHRFLTKKQIGELDNAQAAYQKNRSKLENTLSSSNQGLLQIASTSKNVSKAPEIHRPIPSYENFNEQASTVHSSASTSSSYLQNVRKKAKTRGGAQSRPLLQAVRRGAREKGRLPSRFLL